MESPILLQPFTHVHANVDYYFTLISYTRLKPNQILVTAFVTPNFDNTIPGVIRLEFQDPIEKVGVYKFFPGTTILEPGFAYALYAESVRQLSSMGLIEIADPN